MPHSLSGGARVSHGEAGNIVEVGRQRTRASSTSLDIKIHPGHGGAGIKVGIRQTGKGHDERDNRQENTLKVNIIRMCPLTMGCLITLSERRTETA